MRQLTEMPREPAATRAVAGVTLDAQLGALAERAEQLAQDVFSPIAAAGPRGRVNRDLVRALGEHGILAELFPAAWEQRMPRQVSARRLCVLKEYLGKGCTAAEDALGLQGLGFYPVLRWGTDTLLRRWLGPVVAGEAVAAYALTEPGAGSDAAQLELRASQDGDGYRLSGTKVWISNAPDADIYTVFARTTQGAGAAGVTAFVVPGDSPGLEGSPIDLLVSHPVGRLEFDGVYVPRSSVLGAVDDGFRLAMKTLNLFRISVGAFGVGLAQAALDVAIEHADLRHQFGVPLRDLQAVAHKLADMATATMAARLMVYHVAGRYDDGPEADETRQLAAMAKLFATESAQRVVDDAVQIVGAAALQDSHLLGHLYREVRAPRIYEGATEVLRSVVGRELYR